MKLSIVIPAHNEEKYVGKCLESIFKEMKKSDTDIDIEIIVVDNASDDKTAEVASFFSGVKVIFEPKKGTGYARQAGFLASSGDIIANIDADCILSAGWIKNVFSEFSKDQKLAALSGPYIYPKMPKIFNIATKIWYAIGFALTRYVFRRGAPLQGGNFIVRRDAMEKVGGFDTSIKFYGDDTDIACRIQKVGKIKFTFDLIMYSSERRLRGDGIFMTVVRYAVNYIWVIAFGRPFSREYNSFREN